MSSALHCGCGCSRATKGRRRAAFCSSSGDARSDCRDPRAGPRGARGGRRQNRDCTAGPNQPSSVGRNAPRLTARSNARREWPLQKPPVTEHSPTPPPPPKPSTGARRVARGPRPRGAWRERRVASSSAARGRRVASVGEGRWRSCDARAGLLKRSGVRRRHTAVEPAGESLRFIGPRPLKDHPPHLPPSMAAVFAVDLSAR